MDVAEVKSRDYPPRLYPEGSSNLEKKDINHNFRLGTFPHIRETIGLDVWEELVNSPIGVVARLAGRESVWSGRTVHYLLCRQLRVHKKEIWCLVVDEAIRFSLLEFGEITGLNTGPLPTESHGSYPWSQTAYEVLIDSIKPLAPEGGPYTISGITVALLIWAYESVACFSENFGRVVNNEDVPLLRWDGKRTRASFDNLAAEIKEHGEVRVRRMVLKDSIEEMFPKWPGEPGDPQLVSLITDIHAGRFVKGFWEVHGNTQGNAQGKGNEKKKKMKGGVSSEAEPPTKKQKKVKTQNEYEVAAAGKGSSEKEGSKDLELENKATLRTIESTLDNISRKFEQFDSRLEAYELDRNRPLMDQKTIDDNVKALLEERMKVMGVGKIPENNDNPSPPSADKSLTLASPRVQTQQKSVNSTTLAATPGKVFGPKKNLAKELDKESGVKRTLAEEFGSVAKATDLDSQHVDFVLVSPSKATKDDKDAKVPAYGRGCRGNHIVKGKEADEKKKAAHADATFNRKEKAEAKKKAAEAKKKEAEAKKKEAEGKKKKETEGKKKQEAERKKKEAEAKKKEAEGKKKQEAEGKKKEAELKKKQEAELKKRKQAESKNKEVTPYGIWRGQCI
ncbi:axoneme-associated protein mst101(2)-like [Brassica napus]|uniref:axoneme-associated protein mst101(2)-like n=1 Tax=Brassica napus TaxID=3708 RepID=UPI002079FFE3|nr:axoneme-associated protein mst101(2)-like [Brassica napus]